MGDPFGMAITHAMAAGMGGVRAAGDLVARMQMTRGMKNDEAKKHVAQRLKIGVKDLTDEAIMDEVRREMNLGLVSSIAGFAKGIEAKYHVAKALDIEINCLNRTRERIGH